MHSPHRRAFMAFTNSRNTRDGIKRFVSSSGLRSDEVFVANAENPIEIYEKIREKEVVDGMQNIFIFDEGNLHTYKFVPVVKDLMKNGKVVVVAGLNLDFRGEFFGPMGKLEEIARSREAITGKKLVDMHHSYCCILRDEKQCGKKASYTFRLIKAENDGNLGYFHEGVLFNSYIKAPYHHPTILVEGSVGGIKYTTACSECFGELPGKSLVADLLSYTMDHENSKYNDLVDRFSKQGDICDALAYTIEEKRLDMFDGIYRSRIKSGGLNDKESRKLVEISKARDSSRESHDTFDIYHEIKSRRSISREGLKYKFGKIMGFERILADLIKARFLMLDDAMLKTTRYVKDPVSDMYIPLD